MRSREQVVEAATRELDNRLSFNLLAYGKPWTQEYGDTEFLFPDVIVEEALAERDAEIERLRALAGEDRNR